VHLLLAVSKVLHDKTCENTVFSDLPIGTAVDNAYEGMEGLRRLWILGQIWK
jgi:hypothetical protein